MYRERERDDEKHCDRIGGNHRHSPISGTEDTQQKRGRRTTRKQRYEHPFQTAENQPQHQCHDHKYDPLTQSDYYRLLHVFNQVSETGRPGRQSTRIRVAAPFLEVATADQKKTVVTV